MIPKLDLTTDLSEAFEAIEMLAGEKLDAHDLTADELASWGVTPEHCKALAGYYGDFARLWIGRSRDSYAAGDNAAALAFWAGHWANMAEAIDDVEIDRLVNMQEMRDEGY